MIHNDEMDLGRDRAQALGLSLVTCESGGFYNAHAVWRLLAAGKATSEWDLTLTVPRTDAHRGLEKAEILLQDLFEWLEPQKAVSPGNYKMACKIARYFGFTQPERKAPLSFDEWDKITAFNLPGDQSLRLRAYSDYLHGFRDGKFRTDG